MKDKLGGKIMKKFIGLRAKTYNLIEDSSEDKKVKGTKRRTIKRKVKLKIIETVKKQLNLKMN